MHAILYRRFGGPEELELADMEAPRPGWSEVLLDVQAAALNPKDVLVQRGRFRLLSGARFPMGMGYDVAGTVRTRGALAKPFRDGELVYGFLPGFRGRTLADQACVPARALERAPRGLTAVEAASLPLAGLTALQALRDRAELTAGQRVAILGASGGVGSLAIQVARCLGAHVTAVAGARNQDHVRALGAHEALDYAEVDALDGSRHFDVVFDVFGSRRFDEARRALGPRGVFISTVPSARVARDVVRSRLASGPHAELVVVAARARDLAWLRERVEAGEVRPVVDRVYPLAQAREACAYLLTKRARGKVVIDVAGAAGSTAGA